MKCALCEKNEATVHLSLIAGTNFRKVDLCGACAKDKGVSDSAGFSLLDLLESIAAKQQRRKRE